MITKKILFFFLIASVCITLFSCKKDEIVHGAVNVYTSYQFKIVKDVNYGAYLEFGSKEDLKLVNDRLDTMESAEYSTLGDTPLDTWESTLKGFTSLRTYQKVNKVPFEQVYSSAAYATLLNQSGYIKVEGILYHDTGNEVYTVVDGKETLFFVQDKGYESQTKASTPNCSWADVSASTSGHQCASGMKSMVVDGTLDHWTRYLIGDEKIYLRTNVRIGNCSTGSWSYNPYATFTWGWNMSYVRDNVTINVGTSTASTNAYGSAVYLLDSGNDICMKSAVVAHHVRYISTGATLSFYTNY